jgi:pectate lyase
MGSGLPAQTEAGGSARRYLDAVARFADTALERGRDVYGSKHTPLFVDGLSADSLQPPPWRKDGEEWILSNLASQQNLFRTLDGLTALTGQTRYRQAAVDALRHAFGNLCAERGLLYWGGHVAYDARGDRVVMEQHAHELKRHYPYYALMWQADPDATRRLLEMIWAAHVRDWSRLVFNRHGAYHRPRGRLWAHPYDENAAVYTVTDAMGFCNTGSDLIYAGAMLHRLDGAEGPLIWARRLGERFARTRNGETGLVGYQITRLPKDRAQQQFAAELGPDVLEGTLLAVSHARLRYAIMGICQLKLSEMLGRQGRCLRDWALLDLAAYARHAYDAESNTFHGLVTDGRRVGPEDVRRPGYYRAASFEPRQPGGAFFWAYALAYRLSGDRVHWDMVRRIGRGLGLGDLGDGNAGRVAQPGEPADGRCADPYALLGVLELHRACGDGPFLRLAGRVADNIVAQRFRRGLFLPGKQHVFAKLDAPEPVALLRLVAERTRRGDSVPDAWPGESYFHCPHDGIGRTTDNRAVYARTRN